MKKHLDYLYNIRSKLCREIEHVRELLGSDMSICETCATNCNEAEYKGRLRELEHSLKDIDGAIDSYLGVLGATK